MSSSQKVRRYWVRDMGTEFESKTSFIKTLHRAAGDIASALSIKREEAEEMLIRKGRIESKYQLWVLETVVVNNPFDYTAKKTPLV